MNLDKIIYSGLDADTALTVQVKISQSATLDDIRDSWNTVYYADQDGYIHISGLGPCME
jgi:hypothetical protein